MSKMMMGLIAILVILAYIGLAISGSELVKVPLIENISEANATVKLENAGLKGQFQKCFSNTIPKHIIIPSSQDPKENFSWLKGDEVIATVSLGRFPLLIGMREDKANETLRDLNLSCEIIEGRNSTFKEGFVYSQDPMPSEADCINGGSKVKLFVNSPSRIIIVEPKDNTSVTNTALVEGRLLDPLNKSEHLWIAIQSLRSIGNWYPQTSSRPLASITPINGEFQGNAYLGGVPNEPYEIAVLIVDNETNKKILEWANISLELNSWSPITQGYPNKDLRVPKDVIEKRTYAKVKVKI